MNLVEMVQRDPAHIATRKNLQKLEEGTFKMETLTYLNHWPVAHIIYTFADKHRVVGTVKLKLGSETNAQRDLV